MELVADILSWFFLVTGGLACIIGVVGILRMPDAYTRLHASSVMETVGVGFILIGLFLQSDHWTVLVRLAVVAFVLLFTSPVTSHAVARAMKHRKIEPVLREPKGEGS